MPGRMYTVQFSAVAATVAQDFFEFSPADDKPIELCGLVIAQTSDLGDAAEEILQYSVVRGHATSGSGGSVPTPQPLMATTSAAGFAAEVNNTTIASTGTPVTLHNDAFNIRSGLVFWWPDGFEPGASQGNTTLVVRLLSTPADSLTISGTAYVRELG